MMNQLILLKRYFIPWHRFTIGKSLCEVKGKGKINLIFDDETNYEVNHSYALEQGQI